MAKQYREWRKKSTKKTHFSGVFFSNFFLAFLGVFLKGSPRTSKQIQAKTFRDLAPTSKTTDDRPTSVFLGALKNKLTDLGVVGWFLGGQKVPGLVSFFVRFFIVFLNSPHRETPKNVIKTNREKIGFGFLSIFYKNFSTRFFCVTFFVVFLYSHR
jgi:hypothetical protein